MSKQPDLAVLERKRFVVDVDRMRLVDVARPIAGAGPGAEHGAGPAASGGALATLNRSAASSLNRNRNRNRNRNGGSGKLVEGSNPAGSILAPWRERAELHRLRALWIDLPVAPPPSRSNCAATAASFCASNIACGRAIRRSAGRTS